MKLFLFVAAFSFVLCGVVSNSRAQCTDLGTDLAVEKHKNGDVVKVNIQKPYLYEDALSEEQKKLLPPERSYSAMKVRLPESTTLMISLDMDLSSGFVKKNDRIPFTVQQNVYAHTQVPYLKRKETAMGRDGLRVEFVEEMRWKRCIAIAKGTKLYGTVEKSKEAYPFYLNGKSRLSIVVTELKLDSSDSKLR